MSAKRRVIYTVLTGGYDRLLQPDSVRDDIEYVCFSDRASIPDSGIWQLRSIPYSHPDPARLSRFPKINPHLVLPEYEESLYVDANITIGPALYDALDRAIASGCEIGMVQHPERDDVYDEALTLLKYGLGEPMKIYRQAMSLLETGFPRHSGLFVCSIIFRKHFSDRVRAFDEEWWRLFSIYSKRDQLSVMPALCAVSLKPVAFLGPEYVAMNIRPHDLVRHESQFSRIKRFSQRTVSYCLLARNLSRRSKP